MHIEDFGTVEMTRVTLERGAFNQYTPPDTDTDQEGTYSTDYGIVFYFTFI